MVSNWSGQKVVQFIAQAEGYAGKLPPLPCGRRSITRVPDFNEQYRVGVAWLNIWGKVDNVHAAPRDLRPTADVVVHVVVSLEDYGMLLNFGYKPILF
jgi:hypothetical protein